MLEENFEEECIHFHELSLKSKAVVSNKLNLVEKTELYKSQLKTNINFNCFYVPPYHCVLKNLIEILFLVFERKFKRDYINSRKLSLKKKL